MVRQPPALTPSALLQLAGDFAWRYSDDPDRKVGCLIVDPQGWLVGVGANRLHRSVAALRTEAPHLLARKKLKSILFLHAEYSAIDDLVEHDRDRATGPDKEHNLTAAVTYFPCDRCAYALITSGVRTLISVAPDFKHARWGRLWAEAHRKLREAGVEMIFVEAATQPRDLFDLPPRRPTWASLKPALDRIIDEVMDDAEDGRVRDADATIQKRFDDFFAGTDIVVTWSAPDDPTTQQGTATTTTTKGTVH